MSLVDVTDDYIGYSPEGSRYLHDICAAMIGMNRYAVSQLASQVPTMLALVRAGLGCALIPRSIMAMGVQGVRYRELDAGRRPLGHAPRVLEPRQPEPRSAAPDRVAPGEPTPGRLTAGVALDLELALARRVVDMTAQEKLGSGFGYRSTADDVLAGLDLTGKLALVTGGYSGIGLETTKALVKAGARVVVPARRPSTAQEALSDVENVEIDDAGSG